MRLVPTYYPVHHRTCLRSTKHSLLHQNVLERARERESVYVTRGNKQVITFGCLLPRSFQTENVESSDNVNI